MLVSAAIMWVGRLSSRGATFTQIVAETAGIRNAGIFRLPALLVIAIGMHNTLRRMGAHSVYPSVSIQKLSPGPQVNEAREEREVGVLVTRVIVDRAKTISKTV